MKYLFILLPSFRGDATDLEPITNMLEKEFDEPGIMVLQHLKHSLSAPLVPELINGLLKEIDEKWEKNKNSTIIFIGHSMGALLARKLYVCACGKNDEAPMEQGIDVTKDARPWAAHVERIILLAGMNNGWTIDFHLSPEKMLFSGLGSFLERPLSVFGKPFIYRMRKGGTFITQLKIQSLVMQKKAAEKGVGGAVVIQLLGTIDDMVSPSDNVDLVSGKNFIYLEMPYSGHKNVIDLDEKAKVEYNGKEYTKGEIRKEILLDAIKEPVKTLEEKQIITAESKGIDQDEKVTDVVFVIHGIRDEGFWTQKVAQSVVRAAKDKNNIDKNKIDAGEVKKIKFETETSSYGYFPLLDFFLKRRRDKKIEWIMEQYTENMAKYPEARFSYVGHSNGTYLLSKSLDKYPATKFKHIVLAGSVINHKYDWGSKIAAKRVEKVLNIAASKDLVVGIFPHAFHYLSARGLGAGGYRGFVGKANKNNDLSQVVTVPGGHGAAIEESYWKKIADFIVNGKLEKDIDRDIKNRSVGGWLATVLFILTALLLSWGAYKIFPVEKAWKPYDISVPASRILAALISVWFLTRLIRTAMQAGIRGTVPKLLLGITFSVVLFLCSVWVYKTNGWHLEAGLWSGRIITVILFCLLSSIIPIFFYKINGLMAVYIFISLVVIILSVGALLFINIHTEPWRTLVLLLYIMIVYRVLTRF